MGLPGASKEGDKTSKTTLADANAALEEMKRTGCIGAQGPYILEIVQDPYHEYHHKNDFQRFQYTYNTPFTADEWENIQYQTFVYHEPSNEESKMYTQHVHAQKEAKAAQPASDAPKKKISLSAWKNRQNGSAPGTPTSGEPTRSLNPVERLKKEEFGELSSQETDRTDQDSTSKRKRADSTQDSDREDGEAGGSPASKRSRPNTAVDTRTSADVGMPDKLSPLRQRETEDDLPPRLSSKLPQNIIDAVEQRKRSASAQNSASKKEGKSTPSTNGTHKQNSSPAPVNGLGTSADVVNPKISNDGKSKAKQDTKPVANGVKPVPKVNEDRPEHSTVASTTAAAKKTARPVTPNTAALSPESVKGQVNTPNLRKGIAMTRVHSVEGTTPGEADTPLSAGLEKTPSKISNKTPAQQAWDAKKMHLDAFARKLKHESQDYKHSKPPNAQLAALKAMECLTTYMISFSCIDFSAALAEPRAPRPFKVWTELKELFRYLKFVCTSIAPLNGMAALVTLSYASHVLDVIESAPKSHDKEILFEYLQLQRRASKEVNTYLNVDVLLEDFPKAWKQAKHGKLDESVPAMEDLFSGPYHLPVCVSTPPLQAARAARAMLAEWIERSEIKYKLTDITVE